MSEIISKSFFSDTLIDWQKKEGRNGLPWQATADPYARWVAEIMLQQTQVSKVIGYYLRFMERFPTVDSLAKAGEDAVLAVWSGLGYYTRARNLRKAAQQIVASKRFPMSSQEWEALPGVGRSTAGAIYSAVTGRPAVMLDANAKRVLARYCGCEEETGAARDKALWASAEALLPAQEGDVYSQALMDLGALVCTASNPACLMCPVSSACRGFASGNPLAFTRKNRGKEKPLRLTYLLVDANESGVVLEKRPQKGIWGGLWSLPEADLAPEQASIIAEFSHVFSHFRLNMTALACPVPLDAERRRVPFSELKEGPLPAPIKSFLVRTYL